MITFCLSSGKCGTAVAVTSSDNIVISADAVNVSIDVM